MIKDDWLNSKNYFEYFLEYKELSKFSDLKNGKSELISIFYAIINIIIFYIIYYKE